MRREGEIVGIRVRGGATEACVIATVKWKRGGRISYVLGPLDVDPKRPVYYEVRDERALVAVNRRASAKEIEAAKQSAWSVIEQRTTFQRKRTERRWAAIDNLKTKGAITPGKIAVIRGPHGSWTAPIVAVNLAKGKVGIRGTYADAPVRTPEPGSVDAIVDQLLASVGSRRPRSHRKVRWISATAVLEVRNA